MLSEQIAKMMETIKANKGVVIRVVGVVLGAAVGVAVSSMVIAAQDAELMGDDLAQLDGDPDDLLEAEVE